MPLLIDSDATFSLGRFVEDVRVLQAPPKGEMAVERLPDGRSTLIFRMLKAQANRPALADLTAVGPHTRALFKRSTDVAQAVILQLKPGWSAALLGVPASALTDKHVPLEKLWGHAGDELLAQLTAARSLPEMLSRFSSAIALRMPHTFESASARLARRAVRMLEAGEVQVASVAERLGVTARHLRRAFSESIGIGPKEFARTVRLRRAVALSATSHEWGAIAADAGYYDQAHLIADFHQLVGLTPGAWSRRAPATVRAQPASH